MSEANPFFGLAPPKTLPESQLAFRVREVYKGRLISDLVTPYLPEALADLLLKARRPINRAIHDGEQTDPIKTRIIPKRGALCPDLRLEVMEGEDFTLRSIAVLTAFVSDGEQVTGLLRGVNAYQNPSYGMARQKLAKHLMQESGYHPDVALAMTCCAAGQPKHLLWSDWEKDPATNISDITCIKKGKRDGAIWSKEIKLPSKK